MVVKHVLYKHVLLYFVYFCHRFVPGLYKRESPGGPPEADAETEATAAQPAGTPLRDVQTSGRTSTHCHHIRTYQQGKGF